MELARSGLAVAAGFAVFSILFAVIGPGLGAVLTTIAAGVMAGYLTAKIAGRRETAHGGATAGLVAASLVVQPVLTLPARILVAAIALVAISAGAWIRGQGRMTREAIAMETRNSQSGQSAQALDMSRQTPEGDGGEERS